MDEQKPHSQLMILKEHLVEHYNTEEKFNRLKEWCKIQNVQENSVQKVFDMLKLGKRGNRTIDDPIQFPNFYIQDEKSHAWHDPQQYPWVKLLQQNFQVIREEALAIFEANLMGVHPENDDLAGNGTWNTFFFYKNGKPFPKNHKYCPFTASILKKIPGSEIAGRVYFSAMAPNIHIKPHCGPHNFKLRTHLGIITPKNSLIRVGDIIRNWIEGKCMVFDDSFEHEVWNRSNTTRIVLIVDVWNPSLSMVERKALEYIMPEFYEKEK
jgi:aspartate beta-hydroxylase